MSSSKQMTVNDNNNDNNNENNKNNTADKTLHHPNSVYSQIYKHSKQQSRLKIFYQTGVSVHYYTYCELDR